MATATDDPTVPNGNANPAGETAKVTITKDTAKPRADRIPYLVFEATENMKAGDKLTFLGRFEAESKSAARWAAVDSDPKLAERVTVPAGEKGGVFLLAVAERMATPELTVEEVVQTKVRK